MHTVRSKHTPLTLRQWVEKLGTHEVAEILSVNLRSVQHWCAHKNLPRPEQMIQIKRSSRGRVTCDSMVENYLKNRKR